MRRDILPGASFPSYDLADHDGRVRKLSDLQGGEPMILVLARGSYCPQDRRQLEGLVELHREMSLDHCRLVTITTDHHLETNELRSGVGAHWPFLSDPERIVQKDLEIAEYTDARHDPMIPHTIVLEPGLVVFRVYIGYWLSGRPSNDELRIDLRAVMERCRPDFDITRPGVVKAWQSGQRHLFHPYVSREGRNGPRATRHRGVYGPRATRSPRPRRPTG